MSGAPGTSAADSSEQQQQQPPPLHTHQQQHIPSAHWSNYQAPEFVLPHPHSGVHAPPRPRFNSLEEAFGAQRLEGGHQQPQPQPHLSGANALDMSNAPPIPGSPLASPQSQLSQQSQGYDSMAPPPASPFPPHMQQYASHSSPAPMSASPVHGMPPPQSPAMSPAPGSVGGAGMYQQMPATPQRPGMPQGMPLTPGGSMQMMPPGTPGGCAPMTPQSQQQHMAQQQHLQQQQQMQQHQMQQQQQQMQQVQPGQMMQPGQQMIGQPMQPQQMQPVPGQMMGMPPQGQMMMQGQQQYYPQQGQQWPPQQQMMPPQLVKRPQMMGAAGMPVGAPPQRVMIQRVPYPNPPAYPPGTIPPQQPMPAGPQYARPLPPQYPQTAGQPAPQYPQGMYPAGAMPAQSPVQYPGGSAVPAGMQPQAAVPSQYQQQQQHPQQRQQQVPPQQQQPPPPGPQQAVQQQMMQQHMRPQQYMQSPQGPPPPQQQMMAAAGQQPVYPPSAQQQPQPPPGTPQTPFANNGAARYPPGTPTNSSPLHGAPQQPQQVGGGGGVPAGTPGTPVQQQQLGQDMRSPQLMSPSQAQMMQQHVQQQPMLHPGARPLGNGDMHMRGPMPPQPGQQLPLPPGMQPMPVQQHTGGPYLARDPSVPPIRPDMTLVGCHFIVLDWERYSTERTDQAAMKQMVRSLGGDIDFGPKAYEQCQRGPNMITHGIISYLLFTRPGMPQPAVEHALHHMIKEGKRIVTMQWLVDVIDQRKMEVPWRIAHLPVPMPLENMRANHGRIIAVAGFPEGERAAAKYMVEAIGAKMMPGLSHHTHLLVAKNPSSEKFQKAREWGVPTVNLQWLVDAYLGQRPLDLEHPRYQVSLQPPIEISCGPFTLELLHEHYKHCLAAWRNPVPCLEEHWARAQINQEHLRNDERAYPLKRLKMQSSPAPTEERIAEAHAADPPTADRRQIVVAFEGLDEELESAMGRKIRMLGGCIAPSVEKCSHLVALDGKRTVGLLKALALGKNIVSPSWVNSSYEQNRFADTLDFFLHDEEAEKMHNCNFKLSVMRARRSPVFEDCEFYITPSVDPSPEIVGELVRLGGGLVHAHPPSPAKMVECLETDKPYLLIATECDMPILKYLTDAGVSVFSTELVFTALMRQEVEVMPGHVVAPNACAPAPLRLPPMGAAPIGGGGGPPGGSSAASTPSRRTSTGYAATPPGSQVEFASPQTPRIKAN